MKKNLSAVSLMLLLGWSAHGQAAQIFIHAQNPKIQISRHIYGHFAEHLGRCIYGGVFVGDDSQIPNTNGVRNDVIHALRNLKVPNLRWPGGCFADTYHWKEGIGKKSDRPQKINSWWGGGTENNSFGTHEFLNMCEQIGAEPYLAANAGSGTVEELSDWVQYVNFSEACPMSQLRIRNGREKPWKVKFWGVGNEAWGCGGNMKPEFYANLYRQFATFMSNGNNKDKLFRIASGANSADYNWTEVLMRDIPHHLLEGTALHHYAVTDWNNKGPATDFTEQQYFATMKKALQMETLVSRHSAIMDKYDPEKKVALAVDEWGGWYEVEKGTNPSFLYQQNTMRDAMIAGVTLNIFNNHADRVRMANLAQIVNVLQSVILTDHQKLILTPTYHVMEMYNVHQDAKLLPLDIDANYYTQGNEQLPAISASASIDPLSNIHISLVNIDALKTQRVSINFWGAKYKAMKGRILTAVKVTDCNTFESPETVKPKEFNGAKLTDGNISLNIPPFSVVVLELK